MATRVTVACAGTALGATALIVCKGRRVGAAGADTRGAASDRFRPSQVARKSRRLTVASGMENE